MARPPANNPLIDDHTLGALTMAALIALNASIYLGIGNWWQSQEIVKKHPMLR